MPNLVGIGNSQVPTNAMLGGLAYQNSVGEIDIEKITDKNTIDGRKVNGIVECRNKDNWMIEIKKNVLSISKRTNKKIYSRQKSPQVFEMNASIYIWKNKALMNKSNLVTSKTAFYEMPEERSIDIDTMLDWKIVSFLMEKK